MSTHQAALGAALLSRAHKWTRLDHQWPQWDGDYHAPALVLKVMLRMIKRLRARYDVADRTWRGMLYLLRMSSAPEKFGEAFCLSKYSAVVQAHLACSENELMRIIKNLRQIGAIECLTEDGPKRFQANGHREPHEYRLGRDFLSALRKLYAKCLSLTKSPRYRTDNYLSKGSTLPLQDCTQSTSGVCKGGNQEVLYVGELPPRPACNLRCCTAESGSGVPQERGISDGAPDLSTFTHAPLAAALGHLGGNVCGVPPSQPVVEPQPATVAPKTIIASVYETVASTLSHAARSMFSRGRMDAEPKSVVEDRPAPASREQLPSPPRPPSGGPVKREWWRVIDETEPDISIHVDAIEARVRRQSGDG